MREGEGEGEGRKGKEKQKVKQSRELQNQLCLPSNVKSNKKPFIKSGCNSALLNKMIQL